ncbi:MAG: hypothetical protein GY805_30510 [Chloroflexi bacterium]|nr:hypothetical protein [Chloroflexota bacterium]
MLKSFDCPNCQAALDYDAQTKGITVRCPYCSSTVIVPDSLRNRQGQASRLTQSSEQAQVLAEVVQLVRNGRKIDALKQIRENFNMGLKEAKDIVDAIDRHEDIHLGGTSFHTESVQISTTSGNDLNVQTSGRGGCLIPLIILGVVLLAAYFFLQPQISDNFQLVEEVQTVVESAAENVSQEEVSISETAVEDIAPAYADVVLQFGGEEGIGPGFFNDTRRIAVDNDGNIYTGDYSDGRIQVFDSTGKFLATWNAGEELHMGAMTVNRTGIAYIANINIVEKYNGMTGEFLGTVPIGGKITYFETADIAADGSICLLSKERLICLDSSDNISLDISDPFANIPDFAAQRFDIAINGNGDIIILGNETVYRFNSKGQFIDRFGGKGDAEDQFHGMATSIAVDGQGHIYVNDFDGIKVFEGNGRYLAIINSPGIAFDMLVTDENDLLIMDRNGNEVRKYQFNN